MQFFISETRALVPEKLSVYAGEVASAPGGRNSERNEAQRSKVARAPSGKQLSGTARGQADSFVRFPYFLSDQ